MKTKEYYIKDGKIYHYSDVISDRQLPDDKFTSVDSIFNYITENECIIFICIHHSFLNIADKNNLIKNWKIQFCNNISFEKEEGDLLENYPGGYFYFVDYWLGTDNKIYFIFNLNH